MLLRAQVPNTLRLIVAGALFCSAGAAAATGRTIVGEWAPDPKNCLPFAGAMKISAMSLVADEMNCSFKSVVRTGDQVTWQGSCDIGSQSLPAVVIATLQGEKLFVRVNNQPADTYLRCKR